MQQRLINLTFHGIGDVERRLDPGESDVWISRARFEEVLDAVSGVSGIGLTFDDGNASDVAVGLPALRERGLTATFFVCAARTGTPGFLSADDLHALSAAGMTIGSHGMHHRPWRTLDERELDAEVRSAKQDLEHVVGHPVTAAACPFGSYDRRVLRALRQSAFSRVYTSDRGSARAGDWLQARNSVTEADGGDLVARVRLLESSRPKALKRRVKLAVKRWR